MVIKVENTSIKTDCNDKNVTTTRKKTSGVSVALIKPETYIPEDAEKFISQTKTPQKTEHEVVTQKSMWQTAKDKIKSFFGSSKPKIENKKDITSNMIIKNKFCDNEISKKVNGVSTGAKCGAVLGGVAAGAVILTCAPALVGAITAGGFGAVCCGLVGLIGAGAICGAVIGGTLS